MKWSVGTKIGAAFASILAVFVVIGVMSYRSLVVLIEATTWRQHSYEVLNRTEAVLSSLKDAETGQRGYVLTGQERYLDPYNAATKDLAQEVKEAKELTADNPHQQHYIEMLEPLIADKMAELQETIDLRRNTGFQDALKVVLTDRGKKSMDRARAVVAEMETEESELLKQRTDEAAATSRRTQEVIIWGIVFAALFLLLTGYFMTQNIALPLKDISRVAEQIASGDLTVERISNNRTDEVGVLGRTFDRMTQSLQKMAALAEQIAAGDLKVAVQPQSQKDLLGNAFASMVKNLSSLTAQIADAIGVLGSSSNEILASTTESAAGATETATSVAETTTTVEEIRQTARAASHKAKQVAESVQHATQISQEGKKLTEETVGGMQRIREQMGAIAESMVRLSEQSRAIGEIIATVDDLAQQSNLLAVNASIEAAKAGEQGKGFTVVAQEVKSLAEQSKRATNQVRGILSDIQKATGEAAMATEQGTKAVEVGVKQSSQAGETILALAASVTQAEQAALQIAASSQQQLAGMEQVATSMGSIKEATVQNAAATKQVETAARNLNDLGHQLKQLIARFKV